MAESMYSLQEISAKVKELYSQVEADWYNILQNIQSQTDKVGGTVKNIGVEDLKGISATEAAFSLRYEAKLSRFRTAVQQIDRTLLSAAERQMLDDVSAELGKIEKILDGVKKDNKDMDKLTVDNIKKIIIDPHSPAVKLPKKMSLSVSRQFLSQIQKEAFSRTSGHDQLASLVLFVYIRTEDKEKLVPYLQEMVKIPHAKEFVKAIRENMDVIMSAKAFSDRDKEVLKDIFEKKSFLAQLFKKGILNTQKKNNNSLIGDTDKSR